MQNFNQTEAPITYQNYPTTSLGQGPACPESALSYEMNGSSTNEESLATIENTSSYQNDSNSALFSGESSFGMQNSSFTYNEKYSNSFGSAGQPVTDDISQTSMGSSGSVPYEDYRPQAMLKINAQQSNQLALKGDEQPPTMPMLQSPNQASLQSPLTQSPGNNSPCSKSQSFSSPSTPAKPKSSKKKSENIKKLYSLDNAEGRKEFLDQLTSFNEQKKIPMTQCPTVAKCIIDLFKVYQLVKERGGFIDVSRAAKWKEIAETCQITSTSTTAYSLRKQYGKYLLPFECHFEYGDGRDPEALYKKIEEEMKSTKKSSSSSKSKSNASNNANQSQIVQMPSSYPPSTATQQRAKQQLAIQQPGMQQQQQAMQQPGIQQQGIQQSNMPPQPNMQQQQSMPQQQGMQPQGMQSQQQGMQQNIQQPPAFANYSKQQANQMVKSTIYNNQVIYETSMVPFDQNAHHQLSKSAYIDDQNYVNSQMSGQMNNQINSQMNSQMSGQISGQNHQLSNQMNSQMNNQMNNQISNQMNNQMNSQMNNQMTNQMTSQMTSQMTNQMNSPMNQMSGNDSMNYDNLYQPNQQVLGQEYTAQQAQQAYYNQQSFETEGASNFHANNQVLQKSTAVSMQQQQQYYADSGNQYNGANYANNYGDQYSSYAYSDTGLYTDTSRMPVNRSMPNEQSYSSKPYQFTGTSVAAYEYAPQQQPNRANSQANYSSSSTVVQYQPPIGRVQQSASQQCTQQQQQFMLEGSNLDMSMHHQTNPIPDNWPMGNGNLSNNWSPNVQQNCMQMQYQQHQQHQQHQQQPMNAQQLSIESQIQKPQSQQLALPQQQQIANLIHRQATQTSNASYFSGQAFSARHYPHHSAHPHAMHHPHHQAAAFSPASSSLHPMHHHQQAPQTNLSPKNFLGRDTHFPSDCIEGVKPNLEPRRKLTAKDLQPPDAAKLIMGLKSGQLVEFTQSLNQLLILSSEDPIFKEIKLAKNRGLQKQVITHFHELLVKLFPQLFAFETGKSEPAKPDLNNNQTDEAKLDEIIPFCNGNNTELSEEDKRVVSQFISNDNRLIVDQRAVKAEKTYVITSMFPEKEYDRKSFDEPLSNDRSMNGFCEDQYEPEVKPEEVSPLHTISQHKEDSNQRCIAMSTLVRNLSFLKGNDEVFSNDDELLSIFGKIILFDHNHNEKRARACQESASITNGDNGKSSREAWWFEALKMIQGNALVTLANMSGHLNFEKKDEKIILPILEGLLHWATCPSLIALDAFESSTSRKRLAIECLVKMSVYESNVDLLLATPTFRKNSQQIFSTFIGVLSKDQPQIMREFALVILSNLSKSDRNVAAAVCAASGGIVENLVRTLEQYKENLEAAQSGVNPVIGQAEGITTLNMAKRAAACLHDLAKVPENCQYFAPKQQRLVQLITWGHFDNDVSLMLHDIVYELLEAPRPPSAADSTDSPMETGGYIVR